MNRKDMSGTIAALYEECIAGLTETMAIHLLRRPSFRTAGDG